MRAWFRVWLILQVLMAVLLVVVPGRATAQSFTTLHSFTGTDGANPTSSLIMLGGVLYGTTYYGGNAGAGTVFAVAPDGTGLTNLFSFSGGADGAGPWANLVGWSNTLYGTTFNLYGHGTIFKLLTNGTGFTTLYTFSGASDGCHPVAGLVLSGNTLYGTSGDGGSSNCNSGNGTVFALNTDGTSFRVLHTFTGSDGSDARVGLTLSGSTLYGATASGGLIDEGTLFAVNTDGAGFRTLYSFTGGNDGAGPFGPLILVGNSLYGTTYIGGLYNRGTVFMLATNSGSITTLYSFTGGDDGEWPYCGLVSLGSALYGTAYYGGTSDQGTVFKVNTDGGGFETLHSFTAASDGSGLWAGLILSGNTLYGTAFGGGTFYKGTVFSLSFLPELSITNSGTIVMLSWPTNVAGFDYTGFALQSNTNLTSATWMLVGQAPVVVNGLETVILALSGKNTFYRLAK